MILKCDLMEKVELHMLKGEIQKAYNKYRRLNKEERFWLSKRNPYDCEIYNKFESDKRTNR